MNIQFHQHAVEFLGLEPGFSSEALSVIQQCESDCGQAFPASVREWYSIVGTEGVLDDSDLHNRFVPLDEFVRIFTDAVQAKEPLAYIFGAYFANTGCVINVTLDGSNDPMLIENGNFDGANVALFSEFVRDTIWEKQKYGTPFIFSCDYEHDLYPREAELGPDQMDSLTHHFKQFPPSVVPSSWEKFGTGEDWTFRFWRAGQRIELSTINDPRLEKRPATFHLSADTVDQLVEMYEDFAFHDKFLRIGEIQFQAVREALLNRYPAIKLQSGPCRVN